MNHTNHYKIFLWSSHNTGYYIRQDINLIHARDIAKRFNHAQVEGENGYFEEYENGEKVSWSAQ